MKLKKLQAVHFCGDICLKHASLDLARDIFAVTEKEIPVLESKKAGENILSVGTVEDKEYLENTAAFFDFIPEKEEEYRVAVLPDRILILGKDKRGAMWGIYALSEKMGILPLHRFTLSVPEKKEELKEEIFGDHPRTFRFRGWFLNDEDLLTKRIISGGKREIDYPFYGDVCDVKSLDEILETALRLGINTIIPGSLIDIDMPFERALVEKCVERGFYVTQHHVEPVGVSFWTKDNFFKRRGEEPILSFTAEKERMKKVWGHYVKLWAKYGDNVIWQLGLRGKGDEPVWGSGDENALYEEWGKVITEAVRTQFDLIREEVGETFLSTATLWMEGAKMYTEGTLLLPDGVMPIFSDVGCTQMMSSDFFTTPRSEDRKTGLYYHAAYWGAGPHLAPGNDPRKMLWNYDEAIKKGDTEYSILNVSNVREVLYSAAFNSRILWDREHLDLDTFNKAFAKDYFGNEALSFFYPEYFQCIMAGTSDDFPPARKKLFDVVERKAPFPYFLVNDGDIRLLGQRTLKKIPVPGENWEKRLEESLLSFGALKEKCKKYHRLPYFDETLMFITYLEALENWAKELFQFDRTKDPVHREKAAAYLTSYMEERKKLEHAPFENWYRGEEKMNLSDMVNVTLTFPVEKS